MLPNKTLVLLSRLNSKNAVSCKNWQTESAPRFSLKTA